jgi:hypothetical protein
MSNDECLDEFYLEIREVFYDNLGEPLGHTRATVGGENIEEVRQYLTWALEALDKPVLTFGESNGNNSQDNQGK